MIESTPAAAPGAKRDPLRPSARRVVLLLVGSACCLVAFAAGFVLAVLPVLWRWHLRETFLARAMAQDPAIDFASAEWVNAAFWYMPPIPGAELVGYLTGAVLYCVTVLLVALVPGLAVVHILITWLAAALALRADRRLDLRLGRRPALALTAAVMVRVLFTRIVPAWGLCGLVAGVSWLGTLQVGLLRPLQLEMLPAAGIAIALLTLLPVHLRLSIGAARKQLQRVAPPETRVCNACGYSLGGLPTSAEACPECGQVLLENRTLVSFVLGPRVARVGRLVVAAVVIFAAGVMMFALAYSATTRTVVGAWLTARSGQNIPASGSLASVLAPDGAVVKITDGTSTALVTAKSAFGAPWPRALRFRAIEPDPVKGNQRVEETINGSYWWGGPVKPWLLTHPATVGGLRVDRPGTYSLLATGQTGTIRVMFATPEEVSAADWEWLTEPFEPDDESGE